MIKHKRYKLHTNYNIKKNENINLLRAGFVFLFPVPLANTFTTAIWFNRVFCEVGGWKTCLLSISSKRNELSIKFKKSILSWSGSTARARVAVCFLLSWVKILAARIVYDILCLKYGPDCPLKYGPFSYFTVLTETSSSK